MNLLRLLMSGLLVIAFMYCTLIPWMPENHHRETAHHARHSVETIDFNHPDIREWHPAEESHEQCCDALVAVQPKAKLFDTTFRSISVFLTPNVQLAYGFSVDPLNVIVDQSHRRSGELSFSYRDPYVKTKLHPPIGSPKIS